jgi:hypothetical protein
MHAVQHVVDTIVEATRLGTDAALGAGGALMPPQVHLLAEHADQPYLGYLSCRPFYRGNDVVNAMGMMGVAGSLTGASRLLVVWVHQDLCVALELSGAQSAPNGQVVVDAHRGGGHVLRWHPFRLHVGPDPPARTADGRCRVGRAGPAPRGAAAESGCGSARRVACAAGLDQRGASRRAGLSRGERVPDAVGEPVRRRAGCGRRLTSAAVAARSS